MIRLNVFIQVSESNRAAVLEAAKELVVLMICETWQDAESLSAHEKAEHFVTLVPKIQGLASMKLEKFGF